jgi:hypothetical protein
MFLRALFKELKDLWHWVYAYDSHLKCRFNLRVAYQWLIHDYLAHDIFQLMCPWSTQLSNMYL